MAEIEVKSRETHESERRSAADIEKLAKVFAGASLSEAAVAMGAGVLAIIGLVGLFPNQMAAIATIALGASLLVEGLGLASRIGQLKELAAARHETAVMGGGISTEVAAGIAGIALGILALIGIVPTVLLSASAIVFGAALIFGGSTEAEIERLFSHLDERAGGRGRHSTVVLASGSNLLVGIGAIALGILALIGVGPAITLVLVAHLAVGAALTLSGSTMGAQMGMAARQH